MWSVVGTCSLVEDNFKKIKTSVFEIQEALDQILVPYCEWWMVIWYKNSIKHIKTVQKLSDEAVDQIDRFP